MRASELAAVNKRLEAFLGRLDRLYGSEGPAGVGGGLCAWPAARRRAQERGADGYALGQEQARSPEVRLPESLAGGAPARRVGRAGRPAGGAGPTGSSTRRASRRPASTRWAWRANTAGRWVNLPTARWPSACIGRVSARAKAVRWVGGSTCPKAGRKTWPVAPRPACPPT